MRESDLVKAIQDRVKELSARHPIWIAKIVGHGRQRKGLPDLRVIFYGWSLDVETKAAGNDVSPAQARAIREIRAAAGAAVVCWSVADFDRELARLLKLCQGFGYCGECRSPRFFPIVESTRCEACRATPARWSFARVEL